MKPMILLCFYASGLVHILHHLTCYNHGNHGKSKIVYSRVSDNGHSEK